MARRRPADDAPTTSYDSPFTNPYGSVDAGDDSTTWALRVMTGAVLVTGAAFAAGGAAAADTGESDLDPFDLGDATFSTGSSDLGLPSFTGADDAPDFLGTVFDEPEVRFADGISFSGSSAAASADTKDKPKPDLPGSAPTPAPPPRPAPRVPAPPVTPPGPDAEPSRPAPAAGRPDTPPEPPRPVRRPPTTSPPDRAEPRTGAGQRRPTLTPFTADDLDDRPPLAGRTVSTTDPATTRALDTALQGGGRAGHADGSGRRTAWANAAPAGEREGGTAGGPAARTPAAPTTATGPARTGRGGSPPSVAAAPGSAPAGNAGTGDDAAGGGNTPADAGLSLRPNRSSLAAMQAAAADVERAVSAGGVGTTDRRTTGSLDAALGLDPPGPREHGSASAGSPSADRARTGPAPAGAVDDTGRGGTALSSPPPDGAPLPGSSLAARPSEAPAGAPVDRIEGSPADRSPSASAASEEVDRPADSEAATVGDRSRGGARTDALDPSGPRTPTRAVTTAPRIAADDGDTGDDGDNDGDTDTGDDDTGDDTRLDGRDGDAQDTSGDDDPDRARDDGGADGDGAGADRDRDPVVGGTDGPGGNDGVQPSLAVHSPDGPARVLPRGAAERRPPADLRRRGEVLDGADRPAPPDSGPADGGAPVRLDLADGVALSPFTETPGASAAIEDAERAVTRGRIGTTATSSAPDGADGTSTERPAPSPGPASDSRDPESPEPTDGAPEDEARDTGEGSEVPPPRIPWVTQGLAGQWIAQTAQGVADRAPTVATGQVAKGATAAGTSLSLTPRQERALSALNRDPIGTVRNWDEFASTMGDAGRQIAGRAGSELAYGLLSTVLTTGAAPLGPAGQVTAGGLAKLVQKERIDPWIADVLSGEAPSDVLADADGAMYRDRGDRPDLVDPLGERITSSPVDDMLTATDGRPLTADTPTLTRPDGSPLKKPNAMQRLGSGLSAPLGTRSRVQGVDGRTPATSPTLLGPDGAPLRRPAEGAVLRPETIAVDDDLQEFLDAPDQEIGTVLADLGLPTTGDLVTTTPRDVDPARRERAAVEATRDTAGARRAATEITGTAGGLPGGRFVLTDGTAPTRGSSAASRASAIGEAAKKASQAAISSLGVLPAGSDALGAVTNACVGAVCSAIGRTTQEWVRGRTPSTDSLGNAAVADATGQLARATTVLPGDELLTLAATTGAAFLAGSGRLPSFSFDAPGRAPATSVGSAASEAEPAIAEVAEEPVAEDGARDAAEDGVEALWPRTGDVDAPATILRTSTDLDRLAPDPARAALIEHLRGEGGTRLELLRAGETRIETDEDWYRAVGETAQRLRDLGLSSDPLPDERIEELFPVRTESELAALRPGIEQGTARRYDQANRDAQRVLRTAPSGLTAPELGCWLVCDEDGRARVLDEIAVGTDASVGAGWSDALTPDALAGATRLDYVHTHPFTGYETAGLSAGDREAAEGVARLAESLGFTGEVGMTSIDALTGTVTRGVADPATGTWDRLQVLPGGGGPASDRLNVELDSLVPTATGAERPLALDIAPDGTSDTTFDGVVDRLRPTRSEQAIRQRSADLLADFDRRLAESTPPPDEAAASGSATAPVDGRTGGQQPTGGGGSAGGVTLSPEPGLSVPEQRDLGLGPVLPGDWAGRARDGEPPTGVEPAPREVFDPNGTGGSERTAAPAGATDTETVPDRPVEDLEHDVWTSPLGREDLPGDAPGSADPAPETSSRERAAPSGAGPGVRSDLLFGDVSEWVERSGASEVVAGDGQREVPFGQRQFDAVRDFVTGPAAIQELPDGSLRAVGPAYVARYGPDGGWVDTERGAGAPERIDPRQRLDPETGLGVLGALSLPSLGAAAAGAGPAGAGTAGTAVAAAAGAVAPPLQGGRDASPAAAGTEPEQVPEQVSEPGPVLASEPAPAVTAQRGDEFAFRDGAGTTTTYVDGGPTVVQQTGEFGNLVTTVGSDGWDVEVVPDESLFGPRSSFGLRLGGTGVDPDPGLGEIVPTLDAEDPFNAVLQVAEENSRAGGGFGPVGAGPASPALSGSGSGSGSEGWSLLGGGIGSEELGRWVNTPNGQVFEGAWGAGGRENLVLGDDGPGDDTIRVSASVAADDAGDGGQGGRLTPMLDLTGDASSTMVVDVEPIDAVLGLPATEYMVHFLNGDRGVYNASGERLRAVVGAPPPTVPTAR